MRQIHFLIVSIVVVLLSSCNFSSKSNEKTIYIGSNVQPCMAGTMETECLQIKWTKDQPEFEHFYGQIEGFNFEKGFDYELIVSEAKVKNEPSDTSSLRYSLVKTVSKNKVDLPVSTYSDNSNNALDWDGIYEGILPCADCEGIKTRITLNSDGTFNRTQEYLGKNRNPFLSNGKFEWNNKGSIITLSDNIGNQQYQVGENQLFHLDNTGNRIKGSLSEKYILIKLNNVTDVNDLGFEDKKWLLVSFMGKEVKENEADYYIIFSSKDKRLNTKVGCNVMNADYELTNELILEIKPLMSTLMACPENSIEDEYKSNLESVNNITTNGELLHLNRARMTIATYKLLN
ncbi:copper resistance protein NlpE N-terminal domain-containing protein [Arenibacter sp. GZD96]|uniref:copper resistance protein NlpE N-terminal domain-containing protein n=1 Tax=Aurantibrevibacter litoralis TaxID=3106030 RepID=UPI002B00380F|nr:copper resistance protein NlpE N-terminal domain-containing protein [Arenibacter sp. GZD-96]MEA1785159.1 copper resistance protein NlpE N-terminal domain-containing protein [Arenibacter sp. GZD-96]